MAALKLDEGAVAGNVTRYADDIDAKADEEYQSLEGMEMSCGGVFHRTDPTVVAVSSAMDETWPCGTTLEVCGAGGCVTAQRSDLCPGCADAQIDMSRAGVKAVCGNQTGCPVQIRRVQ